MEPVADSRQENNPRNPTLEIPVLKTEVQQLNLPEPRTKTITVEGPSGKTSETQDVSIPFSATLAVSTGSPFSQFRELGLQNIPNDSVKVTLTQEGTELKANILSSYDAKETRYRTEEYNRQYHPAGSQFYPYGPRSTVGEWTSDERQVPYEVDVTQSERKETVLSGASYNAVYAGVYNAALGGSDSARSLLQYLESNFPAQSDAAKNQMKDQIQEQIVAAQNRSNALSDQLSGLSFPPRQP